MMLNTVLGTHAATMGERLPTCARLRLSITKMMKMKASTKPSAICPPTPARDFRALRMTPISVRMMMENG
jgi:hypothetical protein